MGAYIMSIKGNRSKLVEIQQEQLLDQVTCGSTSLQRQIEKLSIKDFFDQKNLLQNPPQKNLNEVQPIRDAAPAGNSADRTIGDQLVSEGKVGCLLIAGGQASRLKFDGPKGMYPVSIVKKKTLFQIFSEKVLAASKRANRKLPFAIMTSPLNHEVTVSYFEDHDYFGLDKSQVYFFQQEVLPFLSEKGNLFLQTKNSLAVGPNGNGKTLHQLVSSGIWRKWKDQGIEYVNQILIDNPLADPFDFELIGHQHRENAEVAIKCTERKDANEKVGVLVRNNQHIEVVEYSELPENCSLEGDICANISLYCYHMDFINRISKKTLPLHLAYKSVKSIDGECMAWKFEYFIFDVLKFTEKVCVIKSPREHCFSPLKNAQGTDSVTTVQEALQGLDRIMYQKVFGESPPEKPFELEQSLYYPAKGGNENKSACVITK